MSIIFRLLWTILFSLVPAVLLGMDFGFSVGLGYFVIAAAILSIGYDVQEARDAAQQIARIVKHDQRAA